jgi:protein TonB
MPTAVEAPDVTLADRPPLPAPKPFRPARVPVRAAGATPSPAAAAAHVARTALAMPAPPAAGAGAAARPAPGAGDGKGGDRGEAPPDRTQNGSGAGAADYFGLLQAWLERHKRYPRRARLRHQEGVVLLRFVILEDGRVGEFALVEGSGHELLDEEARQLVRRAAPLPAIPPEVAARRLELVVPVRFSLR